jgi:hypothetical protein
MKHQAWGSEFPDNTCCHAELVEGCCKQTEAPSHRLKSTAPDERNPKGLETNKAVRFNEWRGPGFFPRRAWKENSVRSHFLKFSCHETPYLSATQPNFSLKG